MNVGDDTALTLGAKPRQPSSEPFTPIGHISLDSESPNPDQADASKGMYCITTFYISRAIQSGGLGSAAMDRVESEAVNEPLNARVLSLDTLANSSLDRKEMWRDMGFEEPSVCWISFGYFSEYLSLQFVGEEWWVGDSDEVND